MLTVYLSFRFFNVLAFNLIIFYSCRQAFPPKFVLIGSKNFLDCKIQLFDNPISDFHNHNLIR